MEGRHCRPPPQLCEEKNYPQVYLYIDWSKHPLNHAWISFIRCIQNLTINEKKKLKLFDGVVSIGDLSFHLEAKLLILAGNGEDFPPD